ncbi:MAG: PqqD family protein [Armatimonadetes bacterium]|nr:PqqD family protein [Armatimonadota bacterium]
MEYSSQCFARNSDLVTRQVAGETLIVPVRGRTGDLESIYTLNEIGTLIWELVDGRTPVARMVDAVCSKFEVTAAEAQQDTIAFLRALEEAGLIRPCTDTGG